MEILGAWNLANIVSSGALGVAANKVAGNLKYVTGRKGRVIYLIGALVLASGGIGGFYITHNDPGDYNNATFRQTLMDPNSWSESAKTIRDCDLLAKIKTEALADDSSCGELLNLLRDRQRAQ